MFSIGRPSSLKRKKVLAIIEPKRRRVRPRNEGPRKRLFARGHVMTKKFDRSISAIALATLVAGTATILPSFSGKVVASAPMHGGKGDRLDMRPLRTQCSEQAWP